MDYFPIFLRIRGRRCLVVGGGAVAARKSRQLLRAGARVVVLAPQLHPALASLAAGGRVRHLRSGFEPSRVRGSALVVAATGDRAVNRRVYVACRRAGIPVNAVDDAAASTYITPAVIDRSPLLIAISSAGRAPLLARMLRGRLESLLPARYGRVAEIAGEFRERVARRLHTGAQRLRFWEGVLEGVATEHVLAGRETAGRLALHHALRQAERDGEPGQGEVYLVGAGPGDPDLLTFRAMRLMQRADVVLYDRLVSREVLDLVRRDAGRIYVGKARSAHSVPQDRINGLLVELARQGRRVLRLKGGDPFLFGRGGEEIESLRGEGIPFQVVPGITAAGGCASYAGIPLTHRDHAHACQFITGHRAGEPEGLDWQALARPGQTLVFYMGLGRLEEICRNLRSAGMAGQMPAAVIEQGTMPGQRTITGTIRDLPDRVAERGIQAPALVIVGGVVALRPRLAWFGEGGEGQAEASLARDDSSADLRLLHAVP